jgi:hypothetical protein
MPHQQHRFSTFQPARPDLSSVASSCTCQDASFLIRLELSCLQCCDHMRAGAEVADDLTADCLHTRGCCGCIMLCGATSGFWLSSLRCRPCTHPCGASREHKTSRSTVPTGSIGAAAEVPAISFVSQSRSSGSRKTSEAARVNTTIRQSQPASLGTCAWNPPSKLLIAVALPHRRSGTFAGSLCTSGFPLASTHLNLGSTSPNNTAAGC